MSSLRSLAVRGFADRNRAMIAIGIHRRTTDGAVADQFIQGYGRQVATRIGFAVVVSTGLVEFRRVHAKQSDSGVIDDDGVAIDDFSGTNYVALLGARRCRDRQYG